MTGRSTAGRIAMAFLRKRPGPIFARGTGSATFDGDKLYGLSRWADLFCFEAASGKIVWNRQIEKEANVKVPMWGFTGAPTVLGDALILNVGENGMAVEKKSGKTIWQSA